MLYTKLLKPVKKSRSAYKQFFNCLILAANTRQLISFIKITNGLFFLSNIGMSCAWKKPGNY